MLKNLRALHGRIVAVALAAACYFVLMTETASAQVTLPDLGVDTAGTATAIGTALGSVVATTITIFGAFLVVRFGLMWIRRTVK